MRRIGNLTAGSIIHVFKYVVCSTSTISIKFKLWILCKKDNSPSTTRGILMKGPLRSPEISQTSKSSLTFENLKHIAPSSH
jgi:hypothetical protein